MLLKDVYMIVTFVQNHSHSRTHCLNIKGKYTTASWKNDKKRLNLLLQIYINFIVHQEHHARVSLPLDFYNLHDEIHNAMSFTYNLLQNSTAENVVTAIILAWSGPAQRPAQPSSSP